MKSISKKILIITGVGALVVMVLAVVIALVIQNNVNYEQCLTVLGIENVTMQDVQERIERTCNEIFLK